MHEEHRLEQFRVTLHRGSREIGSLCERRGDELLAAERSQPAQHRAGCAGLINSGHRAEIAVGDRLHIPAKPRRAYSGRLHSLNLGESAPHHRLEVLLARRRQRPALYVRCATGKRDVEKVTPCPGQLALAEGKHLKHTRPAGQRLMQGGIAEESSRPGQHELTARSVLVDDRLHRAHERITTALNLVDAQRSGP